MKSLTGRLWKERKPLSILLRRHLRPAAFRRCDDFFAIRFVASSHTIDGIKRLPIHPAIRTLEQDEHAVQTGTVDAPDFPPGIDLLTGLTVADMQETHYQVFKHLHPWAGDFRAHGQITTIAGFPAAEPPRISRELEMTLIQTREWIEPALAAHDSAQVLAGIAFFHVRFERVHPFLDGNGRYGRAILAVQFEKAFGELPDFTDQTGYRTAMRSSARRDLAPLINYLGCSADLPPVEGALLSSYQVGPKFMRDIAERTTLEDALAWARMTG